jgi:DNA-binding transcriptional LysR family regulator
MLPKSAIEDSRPFSGSPDPAWDTYFDLVDMRLFVHIAESKSFTRGAARSHMALAAASVRVKRMEQKLGVRLIDRHKKRALTITPAGRVFLRHSVIAMQHVEDLNDEIKGYAKGVKGELRIFADTNSIESLPRVLSCFLVHHPDVNIDLKERSSKEIVAAVRDGSADIGIVAGVDTGDLKVLPYKQDRMMLAISAEHALANHKTVCFSQALEFDYIGLKGSAFQTFLSLTARDKDKLLKIRVQVRSFEALCKMVETNSGVGILPESVARRYEERMAIRLVPLDDDWAVRDSQICVLDLAALPSFAKKLISLLVKDSGAGR